MGMGMRMKKTSRVVVEEEERLAWGYNKHDKDYGCLLLYHTHGCSRHRKVYLIDFELHAERTSSAAQ